MLKSKIASPYLESPRRLADVLTALQVMGTYVWASRECDSWEERLGKPVSAEGWLDVFRDHPEFFRINGTWISLHWRHAHDRNFSEKDMRVLPRAEIDALSDRDKESLTREPLKSSQVEALMKTAIELHNRSIAHAQESRWSVPMLCTLLAVVVAGAFNILATIMKSP